ncbi:archaetidylserine decarboxylase [Psychrobium sp. 1_MG-2023]|uniref:archaetidylserine decarboxylase n=1 Tax=Psychrobium sp. 1_MG-2023 TaxID=3062624 RepID=UPI000C31FDD4|nr:archaetidylserine decarboxylase [Psychrobium sp. 1_MG-2023]MDP2562171.1 archaetidylserine decarboxylase [Psychrobium sp. 1_MG-2023]PKF57208.1 phosphatidylserine decarboxylase [Alteromonadales bacterium alter-6D02]
MGRFAAKECGGITTGFINWFIKQYGIDMSEAERESAKEYRTFNDFFTRALKPGLRPISDTDVVLPVDGCVSQLGPTKAGRIIQAKGHDYSAFTLLGGDKERAKPFANGHFATIYLAPKDYHRIHMPMDATLREMVYVPGDLFSVNPLTAQNVPGLFARNERVAAIFDTEFGPMAMVLVGATIVASIETTWHGTVTPPSNQLDSWDYPADGDEAITFKKGDEMGRFKLGSTVVMLFGDQMLEQFEPYLEPEVVTRLGQPMAQLKATKQSVASNVEAAQDLTEQASDESTDSAS